MYVLSEHVWDMPSNNVCQPVLVILEVYATLPRNVQILQSYYLYFLLVTLCLQYIGLKYANYGPTLLQ